MLVRVCTLLLLLASVSSWAQVGAEPWQRATLYRDAWGVPHVYGEDLRSIAYAFGYAQADDHLEGMLRAYRIALGRAAAVWGEGYVESDEFALRMRHGELAEEYLAHGDRLTRDLCTGFAAGVNAWMQEHPGRTPEWAEAVAPAAPLALLHCYFMSFAPFDLPEAWRRHPPATSGNAFALAPRRSASRSAMLAINPHADYAGPFQWYEAHLMGGSLNVYGTTLFGLPVILQGHNQRLGWAMTPNQADFADMYLTPKSLGLETPANRLNVDRSVAEQALARYVLLNTRTLNIRTPAGLTPHAVQCLMGPHGPVMGDYQGEFVSWRIGGYRELGGMNQLMVMALAQNQQAFERALRMRQIPCFHFVYADAAGNIMYLYNATVGVKSYAPSESRFGPGPSWSERMFSPWRMPLDGSNPQTAWGSVVGYDALPRLVNPDAGYVQAFGNAPSGVVDVGGLTGNVLPNWFGLDVNTMRAQRARRLLGLGTRSFRDAQAILFDTLTPYAAELTPRLLALDDEEGEPVSNAHPDAEAGLRVLRDWSYVAEPDSEGMTLFHAWWWALTQRAAAEGASVEQLAWYLTQDTEDGKRILIETFSNALTTLRQRFNSISVPWGDVHVLRRGDRVRPIGGGSSGEPILIAQSGQFDGEAWPVQYGYGFAMVVEFTDPPQAVSVLPFGTSDNPDSDHFDDQMDLFADKRFKRTHFALNDVQRNAEEAYGRSLFLSAPGVPGQVVVRSNRPIRGRMRSDVTGPASPPSGLAPFSLYIAPDIANASNQPAVDISLFVPESLCRPENLQTLALFRYEESSGWEVLPEQMMDENIRTVYGHDRTVADWYVLMGPVQHRKTTPSPDLLPKEPNDEPTLLAKSGAPTLSDLGEYEPLAPLEPAPPEAPQETPAGDVESPLDLPGQRMIGSQPVADQQEPESDNLEEALVASEKVERGASEQSRSNQKTYTLHYEPVAIGPYRSGYEVIVRPPNSNAAVTVTSKTTIRARAATLAKPPLALPEGMKAYSEIVAAEHSPQQAGAVTFVIMEPDADAQPPGGLESLTLYSCNEEHGWRPIEKQRVNTKERIFSGIDQKPGTYAILGPAG